MRTIVRIILIVLFLFAIGESVAWMLDAKYGFQKKLLEAIDSVEPISEPIPAQEALPWSDSGLTVRTAEDKLPQPGRRILDGRIRPDIHYVAVHKNINHEDLPNHKQKRIFIVGGSAAFGHGSYYKESFGYLLEYWLGEEEFNVFNVARVGATSGKLVPIVRHIVDLYDPYAIIIYSGNNEWMHWTAANQYSVNKQLLQRHRFLSRSRLIAGILYLRIKKLRARGNEWQHRPPQKNYKLNRDFQGFDFALNHPAGDFSEHDAKLWMSIKNNFLNTFENNLRIMLNYCKTRNVKVLLTTVPFNYKLSVAWKYPQPQSMRPENLDEVYWYIAEANNLIKKKEYRAALAKLENALDLDPLVPILSYMEAYCLEQLGRMPEAEEAYATARENVIGNLGSIKSINQRVHKIAESEGVGIVDIKKIFDDFEHAQGSYFNGHLMLDDCHPTALGHRIIAESLMKELKHKN